ncbi:transcription factor SFP1 [Entomortierella parvispora]|uniref:Transcription factor SFP1 n=1 Tax=Entomortierella parvispora TaxID=205924 RepID=A0A9P3H5R2_9FUNG|nr:transcription factor SFP1 [Entomortierella parvispora]
MDPSSLSFRFEADLERPHSPSFTSMDSIHAREFETAFCRDFSCCGQQLTDLHDLLQHYEECHVRFEDDEGDESQGEGKRTHSHRLGQEPEDLLDEESWSDSDSGLSTPSSISLPESSLGRLGYLHGYRSGMDTSSAGLGLALESDLDAAASQSLRLPPQPSCHLGLRQFHQHQQQRQQLQQSVQNVPASIFNSQGSSWTRSSVHQPIIHSTHPLYRRPSVSGSESEVESIASFQLGPSQSKYPRGAAAKDLDVFSASILGPPKRKFMVSLSDIYIGVEGKQGDEGDRCPREASNSSSELPSHPHQRFENQVQSTGDHLTGQVTKRRQVLGPYQHHRDQEVGSNAQHSRPSSAGHQHSTGSHPDLPLKSSTGLPYSTATMDLMRHNEEVYSLIEDLSKSSGNNLDRGDKPYRCSVQGCDKAYKNPNGLKYHNAHGHCSAAGMGESDSAETKPYVCTFLECGKRYKNLNGLKYHIEHSHPNLTAALRAHQSGLICNKIFGPFPQAARTIAAALQAVHASPMMMAAANAIMASQQAAQALAHAESGNSGISNHDLSEQKVDHGPKPTPVSKSVYSFGHGAAQRSVELGPGQIPGPLQGRQDHVHVVSAIASALNTGSAIPSIDTFSN